MVDAPGDRVHVLRRQPQQLDRAAADELARDDHGIRGAGRPLVRARPPQPLGAREELGMVEVLEVVHGHDGRHVERRQRDRERVVDEIEAGESLAQLARANRRQRHRDQALPDAARVPILRHGRLREPLAGAGRGRRCEGDVVERPHLGQAAGKPARGCLGAADLAGDEREEAEPDPHPRERIPPSRYNRPMPDGSRGKWRSCRDFFNPGDRSDGALRAAEAGGAALRRGTRRRGGARTTAAPRAPRPSGSGRSRPTATCACAPASAAGSRRPRRRCCAS